ncbi:MAG: dTMP kinase [Tissierellia bacterium]|nr:dTMP kinase [Tissierellia bacterium]
MKGFITLEGGDGSGKSTLAQGLKDYFKRSKIDALFTREPGGSKIGEEIRRILLSHDYLEMAPRTEALLYAASRAQHVEEVIKPALKAGKLVICERFVLSSIAYQGYGRELPISQVSSINDFATNGLVPDLVLFIHVNWQETLRRKITQGGDRLELSGDSFHKRVYEGYQKIQEEETNKILIDGSKSPNEVLNHAIEALKERGMI